MLRKLILAATLAATAALMAATMASAEWVPGLPL
jgi:hypothetical protein